MFYIDGALADNQLKIGLADLLKADEAGRWWVVGSAWEGHRQAFADASAQGELANVLVFIEILCYSFMFLIEAFMKINIYITLIFIVCHELM